MDKVQEENQLSREKKYLEGRWSEQRAYFSAQGAYNKRWHQWIQIFVGVSSVLVPVLINLPEVNKFIPTVLSVIASSALVLDNVNQYGQKWRSSRLAAEALKSERILFENRVNLYKDSVSPYETFVSRCERIINDDVKRFEAIFESKEEKKPKSGADGKTPVAE